LPFCGQPSVLLVILLTFAIVTAGVVVVATLSLL
jgi:hypothetical protein